MVGRIRYVIDILCNGYEKEAKGTLGIRYLIEHSVGYGRISIMIFRGLVLEESGKSAQADSRC